MNKSLTKLAVAAAFSLTAGFVASSAKSATDTGVLNITVNVLQTCSVEGGSMDFGTYESNQADTVPAIGTITYNGCQAGTVNVALDGGQAASEEPRAMTDGQGNSLQYHIFQDAARTAIWGTGDRSQDVPVADGGSGTWELYGRIIRQQDVPAGSYTDSVNITVTF